jgi:hypothetical protein
MFSNEPATDIWRGIFDNLGEMATNTASPVQLHTDTVAPDRLLAEAAWDLWRSYPTAAPRTSEALKAWWAASSAEGRAILILDGLSLRELPVILGAAAARHIEPSRVTVSGSEIPSHTDDFAHALGLSGRAQLAHSGYPLSFCFAGDGPWTEVFDIPFADYTNGIPPQQNVVVWDTWPDKLVHVYAKTPDQVHAQAGAGLQSDAFWQLVDRLRTGRRLVITADHGYANARQFSTNESDKEVVAALCDTFGASRYAPATTPWTRHLLPPVVFTHNNHHVVMGQRKWKVSSGYPFLCHGGMSLLEVAVPFIEFPSK